jgi:hypothetical protein
MEIPTDDDWLMPIDPDSLDVAWAYKNFHGKSFEEGVRLFEENAINYQEDLMYMPAPVFGFYIGSYIAYLVSEAARSDSDGASCFVGLIRFKAEHDPATITPYWTIIEPALRYVVEHQDDYEADWEIYGSFRATAREILERGFPLTFETRPLEIVPESVTIEGMRYGTRHLSWPVAVQVLRHSGFEGIDEGSTRPDILRVFGTPETSGGGEHPEYGRIPDWIRYERFSSDLRFEFEGDSISGVTFIASRALVGLTTLGPETLERMSWLHLDGDSPDTGEPQPSSLLEAIKNLGKHWGLGDPTK